MASPAGESDGGRYSSWSWLGDTFHKGRGKVVAVAMRISVRAQSFAHDDAHAGFECQGEGEGDARSLAAHLRCDDDDGDDDVGEGEGGG